MARRLHGRFAAEVGILAVLAAAGGSANAQFESKEKQVEPWSYCTLQVPPGEPVMFVAMQPLDLQLEQYELCNNGAPGGWLAVFPTGAPGRVIFVDALRNGPEGGLPQHVRLKVVVKEGAGPDPGPNPPPPPPPPGPDPELKGLAKQVHDLAKPINDPSNAAAIGAAYRGVATSIAAGGISTVQEARDTLAGQMAGLGKLPKAWKPVGDLTTDAMNRYGQTLEGAKKTMSAIADGLEAI